MSRIKGLEVLFSVNQNNFKSKQDCVVAAIHCILINNDLLCVGVGDEFSDNDTDSVTELLPLEWNSNQELYSLRYRCKDLKNRYLLKIVKTGNNLHIVLVLNEDKTAAMTVNTNDYVADDYSSYSQAFKALEQLKDNVKLEILKGVLEPKKKSDSSPKEKTSKKKSSPKNAPTPVTPGIASPQYQPVPIGIPHPRDIGERPAFPQVGGRDLDPFGRSGGSMLFDPSNIGMPSRSPFGGVGIGGPLGGRRPMGLPPGSVPPGARFDPFSPFSDDRSNPNPDHYRPPDYDNMFM